MMSVIIRLQNLPWAANAADIRAYFSGLSIPEGGVHIVGGEQGDAFIAFSTDEDARQAMLLDGGKLKEVKIKLFLSSRAEMLRVIEQARQQTLTVQNIIHGTTAPPSQSTTSTSTSVASSSSQSKVEDQKEEEEYKPKDDDISREKKDRYRSPSRERGRSRTKDSKDRSKDSRDRSRGRHRDGRDSRRRRDRSRSRERHRSRRSRSRERRRNSREKEKDTKDFSRNKQRISKDGEEEKNTPNAHDESSWDGSHQQKVPLLPDPPALPPMLMQMQMHSNGKDIVPPPAPVLNFPHESERRPPFTYNPQMGPIPPQAYMPLRGREGWNPSQMVGVMDPLQMGLPRPMMNNVDMGMGGFPPTFGMNSPMFPNPNPADPNGMWRPPLMGMKGSDDVKNDPESDLCVEIRGLPLNASYIDVKKLFDGLSIPPDGIKMINDNQGNRTGIAYVRFSVPNHKKAALNQNGKKVRSNIVEVIHLRDAIYKTAIDNFKPDKDVSLNTVDMEIDSGDNAEEMWPRENKSRGRNKHHDPRINKSNIDTDEKRTDCVLLQGIPTNSNDNDISDFFDELGIIPVHTHIVYDNMGHPVGSAFCQFKNFEEAEKALSKNNAPLGRQMVNIKRARREEMERARQMQQGAPMWPLPQRPPIPMRGSGSVPQGYGERISEPERFRFEERERYPHDRSNSGMEERNSRYRGGENGGVPPLNRERGPMRGGRGPRGGGGSGPRGGGGGNEHYPSMQHRGGPSRRGGHRERSPYIDDNTLENFGRPGCVVSLENLHFRADIDEIIDFFDGFNVEHENVIRRFDDNGRPTGDARVALNSPAEAMRAVRILNFKMLRGRTVKVSLLQ